MREGDVVVTVAQPGGQSYTVAGVESPLIYLSGMGDVGFTQASWQVQRPCSDEMHAATLLYEAANGGSQTTRKICFRRAQQLVLVGLRC